MDEKMVSKVSVDWGAASVTFYFEGSEDPFMSSSFSGETKKKMQEVEAIMWQAWLKAKEVMPFRGKSREREASDGDHFETVRRNGFGVPFRGAKPGQKVCCLEFQYEGFPDGGKCFMNGVLLKGIVLATEGDCYIVKMAYSGTPYHRNFAFEHVLPMSDEEYDRAGSADMSK